MVSIIVCTKDRADSLKDTLESITGAVQNYAGDAEVVVIDNRSSDHTPSVVRMAQTGCPAIIYEIETRLGKSFALNAALRRSRGTILIFTDDDVRVGRDWISRLCKPLCDRHIHAVAGGILIAKHHRATWMNRGHESWLASTDGLPDSECPCLIGANMAVRREVITAVGGFDEEVGPGAIGHAEDTLFWMQVKEAGFKIVPRYDVVVEHHFDPERLTRAAFARQARKRGEFNAYVTHHWLHGGWKRPLINVARKWMKLQVTRIMHLKDWLGHPSMPEWELKPLEEFYMFKHYARERHRPRNYELRGLRKLNPGSVRD